MTRIPFVGSVDSDNELLKFAYIHSRNIIGNPQNVKNIGASFNYFKKISDSHNPIVKDAITEMQMTVKSFLAGKKSEHEALTRLRGVCDHYGLSPMWVDMELGMNKMISPPGNSNARVLGGVIGRLGQNVERPGKRFRGR